MGCEVEEVLVVEVLVVEVLVVEMVGCEVEEVLVVKPVLVVEVVGCEVDEVLVVEVVVDLASGLRVVCGWEVMSVWVEGNSDVCLVVISSDAANE